MVLNNGFDGFCIVVHRVGPEFQVLAIVYIHLNLLIVYIVYIVYMLAYSVSSAIVYIEYIVYYCYGCACIVEYIV